ncbi:3-oxoacyl-ACP reductase FabG [Lentimicrobium sp. L6]|uniref:3-oxoacyl-ACP reductase FabG n=1 Tax=Lentimicrobium sp. L6 TaxID=2735916 RepID=UPI00155570F3|nr:3-oxoacyl-ACP reductase FabG [Lentimicrobium sp. L6]NPD84393.1 3-oxoacyl-ACP reductase FabG [Lentimicrobium sp. L6]
MGKNYALVTGGSRGIGKAIAIKLASDGFHIIINYRSNHTEAEITLNQIIEAGGSAELLPFDVSDLEAVQSALDSWQEKNPEAYIQVLVNNSGIRKDALLVFMKDEEWSDVLNTNLNSFFYVTRPLIKNMLLKKSGRIINMVSLSGLKGLPGQTNYSATKGGVISATKALAQEVARKKVTVNAVAPGFIKSDMTADIDEKEHKKLIPMNRFGKPEEVADLVSFLASENSSYITGQVISINGGLYT